MANPPKLLSGRVPVTPYSNLSSDRYQFLNLSDAEPSLSSGTANSVLTLGTSNARVWSSSVNLTSANISGNITSGNANLGNVVIANYFSGNGSLLTGITVSAGNSIVNGNSNVSVVANSNVNISAVGNANVVVITGTGLVVNGTANISGNLSSGNANLGNVARANYFIGSGNNLSNIQGANVSGAVSYATTANSVAGANVSGTVANATYATTSGYATSAGSATNATTAGYATTAGSASSADTALTAATVTTNAQPNITSTGTLTSLSVSGNANTGNLGTNNFIATGTGSFGANVNMNSNWINNVGYPSSNTDVATKLYVDTMISSGISYHQPVLAATTTTLATATGGTTAYNSPNGAANGIGAYISTTGTFNLIDTANVQTVGTRILVKDEANAAWNGIYTYANTTAIVRSTDTDEYGPDSVEQLSINDYFFVQSGVVNKGVAYVVSSPAGIITFGTSNIVFAQFSTSQVYSAGTGLTLTGTTFSVNASQTQITSVGTLGSLAVTGNITSGNANLGNNVTANYFTGNGVYLTGITTSGISNGNSNVNIPSSNGNVNISSAGNANIVVVTGTGANINGTLNVTGTATVGNLVAGGSGGNISNANVISANTFIATGNITAGNANLGNSVTANYFIGNFYGTANIATTAGTVTTAAQPNITSVGTLTGLTSTGTINLTSASNVALGPVANVHITGGSLGQYLQTDGSGTLSWVSISSSSTLANGNSNVNIPAANGNVNISSAGNANIVVVTGTGANITGTLNVTGNATVGNIITGAGSGGNITGANVISANTLSISGNITSGNANLGNAAIANYFIGSGANLTNIPGGNVAGQVSNSLIASTVYTNAQPNITSTGTLVNLIVSGNVAFSGANVSLGSVSNLHITGGSANYILQTDGAGTLSWAAAASGSNISNGNSNVNIPSANGNVNISSAGNANIVVVTGTGANISGTLNVSGNATVGNIITGAGSGGNISGANNVSANTFTGTLTTAAQPNITSVGTLTSLSVTGNITSGNANLGNNVSANFFTGNGVYLTGITTSGLSNGNSNVNIPAANGNINLTAVGNTTLVVTGTGINVAGTLNVTGTATVGNLVTSGSGGTLSNINVVSANTFTASGNITAGNANLGNSVTANYFTGNFYGTANTATTAGTVTTAAQPNITSVGTLTSLGVNGTVTAVAFTANTGVFTGNGNGLSSIVGANVTGQVGNALVAGTVYTNAQPNITSVGTLTGLTATGNITGGNLVVSGNGYLDVTGPTAQAYTVRIRGNTGGAQFAIATSNTASFGIANDSLTAAGTDYANLTYSANTIVFKTGNTSTLANRVTIDSVGAVTVVGNLTTGNLIGPHANGNSNVNIPSSNGNVNISAVGVANVLVITGTGANIAGTLQVSGQSNLGAVGNVVITGGTNGYVLSTNGSGVLSWVAQSGGGGSSISNGNSNVSIATANGNITMSAVGNANIVTVTGTGVNVAGTLNVTGQSNLGAVGNVKITGGSNTYVLSTDGTGNLSWAAPTAANVVVDNFTGNGVQTVFTLSTTPIGINQTSINYNGATVLRSDYTLANANITFSSAPANGSLIEVTTINLTSGGSGGITAQDLLSPFLLMGA